MSSYLFLEVPERGRQQIQPLHPLRVVPLHALQRRLETENTGLAVRYHVNVNFAIWRLSHLLSSPLLFSLPPSRSSDPGHIAGSSLPLATTVRALHLYRENIRALSPLVDWHK